MGLECISSIFLPLKTTADHPLWVEPTGTNTRAR